MCLLPLAATLNSAATDYSILARAEVVTRTKVTSATRSYTRRTKATRSYTRRTKATSKTSY
jgi:hypothetical protein